MMAFAPPGRSAAYVAEIRLMLKRAKNRLRGNEREAFGRRELISDRTRRFSTL